MKKVLGVLSVLLVFLTLGACGKKESSNDDWKKIEDKKEVVIGFDNTFVPMGFKDESGNNVGFDIDLASAVFEKYGIKVKMQPIEWSMKETELNNGNIDLIWNGYSVTPQREKQVLFTKPYMENDQVLVTKKSSNISKVSQMEGKILGAQEGSSGYDAFTNNPEVLKDLVKDNDATLYEGFNEALLDLKSGRIDGLLIDDVYAEYYLNKNNEIADYNIIKTDYSSENFAVGARKADKTLVEKINTAIKELHESGDFQKISDKWFGKDVYPK
ncbi:amino acid ABC transporter substrate-binding protein [Streptococcaceae bacterium ESL0729]|nr:amino acid ABC transporter substrate-binding protein [Streptococcaceae bacterium ESL0729]